MPVGYRFKFPLINGLHARPASHFEAVTSRFRSKITLIHERTCFHANARSVLSMVSADVKYDDPCLLQVDGDDEEPAMDAVRRFVDDELPNCDEALPEIKSADAALIIPRSLAAAGLHQYVRGRAVSGGVGWGRAILIGGMVIPPGLESEKAGDPAHERHRVLDAIATVGAAIAAKISASRHSQEVAVLKAHAAIVRDEALSEKIMSLINTAHRTAAQAVVEACRSFSDTLRKSQSEYLRERTLDVEDVCIQLVNHISHYDLRGGSAVLDEPSIVVAEHLTPGQLLGLDRAFLKGLVLSEGGTTSHTVILARSMNIPTLVGVHHATTLVRTGDEVVVDGELGLLVTDIPQPVRRYYVMERRRLDARRKQLDSLINQDGATADGQAVEVGANIATAEEADVAFANGAQGIGLFRTEMLFMDRESAPTEQQQAEIYAAAVVAAHGKPVIIRLLDIGGDKPAPYLKLPEEDNPFLGYRGARLYNEFAHLVKNQIRAILRASACGQVKILVPMICCLEEIRGIKVLISDCSTDLAAEGVKVDPRPQLGVMIEIPSLAFLMPELCSELDFFSIGSNDLTQYFLAADRANQKVAPLYTWSHPAFLRMLRSVVDAAHAHGKWIGLCGEMGDQPAALPLLIGLGLDEISVSPARVTAVKSAIAASEFARCKELLDQALAAATRGEVEAVLKSAATVARKAPILSADLVFISDAVTKQEVIKQLADRMFVAGRVADSQLLEEAIWKREETYSTGFGYGLAVPHCKSELLTANSIAIARVATPIEWGSLDDRPVDIAILLAIRAQEPPGAHMKIFARLSRLVMQDEFRDRLRAETDPAELVRFLETSLDPTPVAATT
jgi:fructose-specific PTS system IIA-like component